MVNANPVSGYVELRSGERLYADVIVGADGYDSILRPLVTEFNDFKNQDMHLFLTFVIPVDLLRADKELRSLVDPRVVCLLTMSMINTLTSPRLVDLLVW